MAIFDGREAAAGTLLPALFSCGIFGLANVTDISNLLLTPRDLAHSSSHQTFRTEMQIAMQGCTKLLLWPPLLNCRDFAAVCLNNVLKHLESAAARDKIVGARTMETLSILIWKWANQTDPIHETLDSCSEEHLTGETMHWDTRRPNHHPPRPTLSEIKIRFCGSKVAVSYQSMITCSQQASQYLSEYSILA
eukprot:scaffold2242_cov168-Skeletonema_marinoi.AAC.3